MIGLVFPVTSVVAGGPIAYAAADQWSRRSKARWLHHPARVIGVRLAEVLVFGLAGAVCRLALPLTHSRIQMSAFVMAAVLFERFCRPRLTTEPAWAWTGANILSAFFAILLVRWHLEGLCLAQHHAPHCLPHTFWAVLDVL